MKTIVIVGMILFVVIITFFEQHRQKTGEKYADDLVQAVSRKDYATYDKLIQDPKVLRSIPSINLLNLRFNVAVVRHQHSQANDIFDERCKLEPSENKDVQFYSSAIGYYADQKDIDRAKVCYDHAQQWKHNTAERKLVSRVYQITFENHPELTDQLLTEMQTADPTLRKMDAYLLCQIYTREGDQAKASEYRDIFLGKS